MDAAEKRALVAQVACQHCEGFAWDFDKATPVRLKRRTGRVEVHHPACPLVERSRERAAGITPLFGCA